MQSFYLPEPKETSRTSAQDDDWFHTGNLGNEVNDLYSIAHHEIGHALMFNPGYPVFATHKTAGSFQDAAVLAYQGSYPAVDASDHFTGATDSMSRRGAFGNEYFGETPQKRWLITKMDLLCARGIGYALRSTSAFAVLLRFSLPRSANVSLEVFSIAGFASHASRRASSMPALTR